MGMTIQQRGGAGQDRSLPHSLRERLLPPREYIRGHLQAEVDEHANTTTTYPAQVAQMIQPLHLPKRRLEQLQTAVAEATMNAMEHGNHYLPDKLVSISVARAGSNS